MSALTLCGHASEPGEAVDGDLCERREPDSVLLPRSLEDDGIVGTGGHNVPAGSRRTEPHRLGQPRLRRAWSRRAQLCLLHLRHQNTSTRSRPQQPVDEYAGARRLLQSSPIVRRVVRCGFGETWMIGARPPARGRPQTVRRHEPTAGRIGSSIVTAGPAAPSIRGRPRRAGRAQ